LNQIHLKTRKNLALIKDDKDHEGKSCPVFQGFFHTFIGVDEVVGSGLSGLGHE